MLQTDHQHDRRNDSARDDRTRQPLDVRAFDTRFHFFGTHPLSQLDERNPYPASNIQKRREEDRCSVTQ